MIRSRALIALASCSLGVGLASGVSAQSVVVHVTRAESGSPLPGAFVSLLDADADTILRSGLTNDAGEAVLSAGRGVRLRVRVEMIGRTTHTGDPFTLDGAAPLRVPVALPLHAISLAEIRVDADPRCRIRPAEASELARVWEAVRTSLAVQAWTEGQSYYRLDISTYDRDLDADGRAVQRESRRARSRVTRTPFAGLDPDDLADGFVRPVDGGGFDYFGPDATLLLSDGFLDTHCFRLTRSGDAGSIGLAFEPTDNGRSDIEGTLWLDEDTGHLRFLEYRYTRLPYAEAEGIAGGRIEFEAMPDGTWIIRRWWIRVPLLARFANLAGGRDSGIRITGIRETGGEVIGVSTPGRQRIVQVQRSSLTGTVWDSTRAGPLAGARVVLTGTDYAADADSAGSFVIDGLSAGVYSVAFTHPRLDSLDITLPAVEAGIEAGADTRISLAIPSLGTIGRLTCEAIAGEPSGVVLGSVTDAASGEAVPGATVHVQWEGAGTVTPAGVRGPPIEATADETGRYIVCGLPTDRPVRVRASLLRREGRAVELRVAAADPGIVDLSIELPARRAAGAATGMQGVQGSVTDRQSGEPVISAEVVVRGPTGDVVASGLSDERGFFRLPAPAPGRYLLTIGALGYRELAPQPVDIERGRLIVLDIAMAPQAVALDPVVATAESRSFHLELEGFYRRAMSGLGVHITPETLERRQPSLISDVLFGLPGVRVAEPVVGAPSRSRAVFFRGASDQCWPMVFVDRMLASTGGLMTPGSDPTPIDDFVHAADVLAVEVYRPPAEIPSEFNGPNAGCGVIVLWTRRAAT